MFSCTLHQIWTDRYLGNMVIHCFVAKSMIITLKISPLPICLQFELFSKLSNSTSHGLECLVSYIEVVKQVNFGAMIILKCKIQLDSEKIPCVSNNFPELNSIIWRKIVEYYFRCYGDCKYTVHSIIMVAIGT